MTEKFAKKECFCEVNGIFEQICKANGLFQLGMNLPKTCLYGVKKVYLG